MTEFTFKQAQEFVLPFGQHRGKTVDKVSETDAGLLYLDYLFGEIEDEDSDTRDALGAFLTDKGIAADVAKLARR